MRTRILSTVMLIILACTSKAQLANELFRQRSTQTKYLLQQINAFKTIAGTTKKGYGIATNGLTTIGKSSRGDLELHKKNFQSQTLVSPAVKQSQMAEDIKKLFKSICRDYNSTYRYLLNADVFVEAELSYFQRVFNRLFDDCDFVLTQANDLQRDNQLAMTDGERMARIHQLYTDMQGKYAFTRNFCNEARVMAIARKKEVNKIKTSRELRGITK